MTNEEYGHVAPGCNEYEEVIRRAEGASYLTDKDVRNIAAQERKPINMLLRAIKFNIAMGRGPLA